MFTQHNIMSISLIGGGAVYKPPQIDRGHSVADALLLDEDDEDGAAAADGGGGARNDPVAVDDDIGESDSDADLRAALGVLHVVHRLPALPLDVLKTPDFLQPNVSRSEGDFFFIFLQTAFC